MLDRFPDWVLRLVMVACIVALFWIWCPTSADAQEFTVTETKGIFGSTYIVKPYQSPHDKLMESIRSRPSTGGYYPRATATNTGLTSTQTPHWQMKAGATGYLGYYHTQYDCDTVRAMVQSVVPWVLSCRYVQ